MAKAKPKSNFKTSNASKPWVQCPKWNDDGERGPSSVVSAAWVDRIATVEPDGAAIWIGAKADSLRALAAANRIGENVACFKGSNGEYRMWRFGKRPFRQALRLVKHPREAMTALVPDGPPLVVAEKLDAMRIWWAARRSKIKLVVRFAKDKNWRVLRVG